MKGSIAADIIASPYRDNPLPDAGSIFFPLFTPSTRVELDEPARRARSRTFHAAPTLMSAVALAAARWILQTDASASAWRDLSEDLPWGRLRSGSELLAACVPLSELTPGTDEAILSASVLLSASGAGQDVMEGASTFISLLRSVRDGADSGALRDLLRQAGYNPDRNSSEMRPYLSGTVIQTAPGKLGIGDGTPCTAPAQVLPAALSALLSSDSYEETVRRATAMGGDPCLTAFLAGGLAGQRFAVPETIVSEAMDYFPERDRSLVSSVERRGARLPAAPDRNGERNVTPEGRRFAVIRMDGRQSVYVIPEGAPDIEAAVKAAARKTGMPYETIRPGDAATTLRMLSLQADAAGRPLDGTYAEHPRPEMKTLWLQDGGIRTSTTRKGTDVSGRALPPPEKRLEAFNGFRKLRDYASAVRSELEALSCADPPEGMHMHFASAFYPVVLERRIDLMQGDILRGRIALDDDGRIRVDTSAPTGGVHTEGLEGVLATMDIFHRNDTPADIMAALDRWCLDRGEIEDEDERRALREGGQEAEGVRRRYRSNIDTAIADLCAVRGEIPVAVIPDLSPRMAQLEERRERKAEKSREKYGGLSLGDVIWSRSHPGAVFTIGHSNLPAEAFEALLRKFGIQLVVDVRSFPRSRFSPQYDGAVLGKRLEEDLGIGYQQAGAALGGHLYEGKGALRRRLTYEETMQQPEFARYLKAIRECAREGTRVALMCSESDPAECHRFVMLGYALAHPTDGRVKPVDVQHITRSGQLLSQEVLENRLVRDLGLSDKPDGLSQAMLIKAKALMEKTRYSTAISLRRNMQDRMGRATWNGIKRR